MAVKPISRLERFEQKYEPCPATGCWLWTGALANAGYGSFVWSPGDRQLVDGKTVREGRSVVNAHNAAWRLYRGEIPAGLEVRHLCHLPLCVNPDHMRLGTHQQNISDMVVQMWNAHNDCTMGTKARNGKFVARFRFGNKYVFCGQYDTQQEAHEIAKARSLTLHRAESARAVEVA